jgi:hypothetical protein
MSNYSKTTNFASKDALASGNPLKTIKGTEFNVEFDALQVASATKANIAAPTFTGVPAAPTANAGTNTTQIATTAFVAAASAAAMPKSGGAFTGAVTTNSTFDGRDVAADGILATNAMPKSGGAFSGAVTTNSTIDGRDVAADGVLATNAMPKGGGAFSGAVTTNSTIDGRDVAADGVLATNAMPKSGGAFSGAVTTNSTIDGRDVAADGVLATNAMPKGGGAFTGAVTTNSTIDGRDVAADGVLATNALPKSGGTMSGLVNMADQIVQRPVLKDYAETKVAMGANDVNLTLGNVFTKTCSGSVTVTFSNPPASGSAGSFTLILTNGGAYTITWPSAVDWAAATAPTLTASGIDILTFTTIDGGTIWYGIVAGQAMG